MWLSESDITDNPLVPAQARPVKPLGMMLIGSRFIHFTSALASDKITWLNRQPWTHIGVRHERHPISFRRVVANEIATCSGQVPLVVGIGSKALTNETHSGTSDTE